MLGCNSILNVYDLKYPLIATYKKDGIRTEIGNGKLLSRSLKPIPNIQINEYLEVLVKYAMEKKVIIEGELYVHGLRIGEINMIVSSLDYNTKSYHNKIKKALRDNELSKPFNYYISLPKEFELYVFDYIRNTGESYKERIERAQELSVFPGVVVSTPCEISNAMELSIMYNRAIKKGYEGLVLRDPKGYYKLGRSTLKEQLFLKMKPIDTLTGSILGVTEELKNTNTSFLDERGYMTKRNTLADKEETGRAAAFIVSYKGDEVKVTITGTDEFRTHVYQNIEKYMGRHIKFKGLLLGAKSKPRHTTMIELI